MPFLLEKAYVPTVVLVLSLGYAYESHFLLKLSDILYDICAAVAYLSGTRYVSRVQRNFNDDITTWQLSEYRYRLR